MTRHITDKPEATQASRRASTFIENEHRQLRTKTRRKALDHPHPVGSGRVVQFTSIDRGREV